MCMVLGPNWQGDGQVIYKTSPRKYTSQALDLNKVITNPAEI